MDQSTKLENTDLPVVHGLNSRYPAVEIVHSTSANTCIPALDKIISQFGIPSVITSDNGPPYNSETFKLCAKNMAFEHKKMTPEAPWANGTAENFMKNLGKLVETSQEEKLNWRQELHKYLRVYRATPHPMTKKHQHHFFSTDDVTKPGFVPLQARPS